MGDVCVVSGCSKPHEAKGLCKTHYTRLWSGRSLTDPPAPAKIVRARTVCAVPGCGRRSQSDYKCHAHYQRFRKGDPEWSRPIRRSAGVGECRVDGCTEEIEARGLCRKHYQAAQPNIRRRLANKRRTYNLSFSRVHALLKAGACVRGFLCDACNRSLGIYEVRQRPSGLIIVPYDTYLALSPAKILTKGGVVPSL